MNSEGSTTLNSTWKIVIWLLRISCFFVFIGRGWQHLISGDAPFRTLLWHEELLTPLVNNYFGMTWNEWATSESVDANIQLSIRLTGVFYFICAGLSLFVQRTHTFIKVLLGIGCALLTSLAFLYYMDRFFQVGQLLEYAAQFMSPALLIWAVSAKRVPPKGFELAIHIAVALTFICHGLYAFGYYPVPGNFVDMVIQILNVSDEQALLFLKIVAILDFAIGVTMLIPFLKPFGYAYAVFWGFATTIARLWAYVSWDLLGADLMRWMPEFLQRIPHATIPAVGLILSSAYVAKKAAPFFEREKRRTAEQFETN